MEKVFIVVSCSGIVMGVFSDKKTAELCRKYYEKKCINSRFSIESKYIDLLSASDYED